MCFGSILKVSVEQILSSCGKFWISRLEQQSDHQSDSAPGAQGCGAPASWAPCTPAAAGWAPASGAGPARGCPVPPARWPPSPSAWSCSPASAPSPGGGKRLWRCVLLPGMLTSSETAFPVWAPAIKGTTNRPSAVAVVELGAESLNPGCAKLPLRWGDPPLSGRCEQ